MPKFPVDAPSAETREVVGIGGGIWRSHAFRGLGCPQMLPFPKGFWASALDDYVRQLRG